MPELIPDGVDIPIDLREQLEEGNVVFFCGAGVSKPSGLPLFDELAEQVIEELAIAKNSLLEEAFDAKSYDKVFNLLERPEAEYVEPKVLREIVAQKLKAKRNADISPHTTILKLTHDQKGKGKLVTTNFDDLFERAYKRLFLSGNKTYIPDTCPRLPIPKRNNSWNSIVHLHGWLFDMWDSEHKNIVLSSADFGRAYLVERWASRFVTELFRCFTVVFVGYQVEDPVMKYLVDAFSEARRSGEDFKDAYAFSPYDPKKDDEKSVIEKWKSKGEIKALTYKSDATHSFLWKSLEAWAELHDGGFDSKCSIVTTQAMNVPDDLDKPYIENMVWALSQQDGNVAKVFANMGIEPKDKKVIGSSIPDGPPPPIEWLPILDEYGLLHQGKGIPNVRMVSHTALNYSQLSDVSFQLSHWLVRHLDKVKLLEWVLDNGTILHYDFRMRARFALENGYTQMPEGMRKVWSILLSEDYANKFSARAGRPMSRLETPSIEEPHSIQRFLNALTPVPKLKRSIAYRWLEKRGEASDAEVLKRPKTYADLSITFIGSEYPDQFVKALDKAKDTDAILIKIIHPLTDILLEIMDLYNYFGEASSTDDLSYIHMPSISPHEQNKDYNKWTIVIELLRRSIDACNKSAPDILEEAMKRWKSCEYPVFKRLALYAATGGKDE